MKRKKRAFTLTELLVVVIVIASLSAIIVPKYQKVLETQKTGEADAIMRAVRTEQERRCTIGKPYTTLAHMSDLVPQTSTKNFSYSDGADGQSLIATSSGKYKYKLQMLSFRDGRVCCTDVTAGDCDKLNKNYPKCSEIEGSLATAPECTPEAEDITGGDESGDLCSPAKTCSGLTGGAFPDGEPSCTNGVWNSDRCFKTGNFRTGEYTETCPNCYTGTYQCWTPAHKQFKSGDYADYDDDECEDYHTACTAPTSECIEQSVTLDCSQASTQAGITPKWMGGKKAKRQTVVHTDGTETTTYNFDQCYRYEYEYDYCCSERGDKFAGYIQHTRTFWGTGKVDYEENSDEDCWNLPSTTCSGECPSGYDGSVSNCKKYTASCDASTGDEVLITNPTCECNYSRCYQDGYEDRDCATQFNNSSLSGTTRVYYRIFYGSSTKHWTSSGDINDCSPAKGWFSVTNNIIVAGYPNRGENCDYSILVNGSGQEMIVEGCSTLDLWDNGHHVCEVGGRCVTYSGSLNSNGTCTGNEDYYSDCYSIK